MTTEVTRLVKEAAEAAKHAPEHLQEAAFNKAFEALVAAQQVTGGMSPASQSTDAKKRLKKHRQTGGAPKGASLDDLDRTTHPDISHDQTGLDNSLRLLRAAKDQLAIDGLTASAIARVLVDKFRCRLTRQAVSMALNRAGRYVNRHKDGRQVVFRIMGPGEEYLDSIGRGRDKQESVGGRKKTKRKATTSSAPKKKAVKSKSKKSKARKSTKRTVGSFAALTQLYDNGFFGSPQSIASIIEHLKHQHGRTFKANEMSPPLLRYLRAGKLTRKKNSDNQYEYEQP